MGIWNERSLIYKVGFAGVNLGTLVFIVSFCAPSWAVFRLHTGGAHHHYQSLGLWQVCTDDLSMCRLALHSDNPGWLKSVRALECIAMFFAVAACFVGLYSNCILKAQLTSNIFNKTMETSALVSVAFGLFGLVMFASQIQKYYTRYSPQAGNVWWGFVLACLATALLLLSTCLMLLAHKLRLISELRRRSQFAHRQFSNSSFHSNVRLPEYSESGQVFISDREGGIGIAAMPPAYDTVVSFGVGEGEDLGVPASEGSPPPPYSQVLSCQGDPPPPSIATVDESVSVSQSSPPPPFTLLGDGLSSATQPASQL